MCCLKYHLYKIIPKISYVTKIILHIYVIEFWRIHRVPSPFLCLHHLLKHNNNYHLLLYKLTVLYKLFFHYLSSINKDMNSLLDMSADLISETPKKKPTTSPQSSIIKRLEIVTPGRVDAADPSCSNTVNLPSLL